MNNREEQKQEEQKQEEKKQEEQKQEEQKQEEKKQEEVEEEDKEITFKPVVKLEKKEIKTNEEDEKILFSVRAKLFRMDEAEWKERGLGEAKILKHKTTKMVRLVMRREKTHKICANHIIQPEMELQENIGSDRAWIYKTPSDLSDEDESKPELFAIRFANSEKALSFKEAFNKARESNKQNMKEKEDSANFK